jgi:hypothetical protein
MKPHGWKEIMIHRIDFQPKKVGLRYNPVESTTEKLS